MEPSDEGVIATGRDKGQPLIILAKETESEKYLVQLKFRTWQGKPKLYKMYGRQFKPKRSAIDNESTRKFVTTIQNPILFITY